MESTTFGLDIAKRVFRLHGVDAAGKAANKQGLWIGSKPPYDCKWKIYRGVFQ